MYRETGRRGVARWRGWCRADEDPLAEGHGWRESASADARGGLRRKLLHQQARLVVLLLAMRIIAVRISMCVVSMSIIVVRVPRVLESLQQKQHSSSNGTGMECQRLHSFA